MKHRQLNNPLHPPQKPNILLKRLRLAKLQMRIHARPPNKRSKQIARLPILIRDGDIILDAPPVTDSLEIGARIECLGLELLQLRREGLLGGRFEIGREEEGEDFGDGGCGENRRWPDGGRDVFYVALGPV